MSKTKEVTILFKDSHSQSGVWETTLKDVTCVSLEGKYLTVVYDNKKITKIYNMDEIRNVTQSAK